MLFRSGGEELGLWSPADIGFIYLFFIYLFLKSSIEFVAILLLFYVLVP